MKIINPAIATILVTTLISLNSCLKSDNCTYNVFENEDLHLGVYIDDVYKYCSDSTENQIYIGFQYEIDSSRTDTVKFYYYCNYLFENGNSNLLISVVKFADFSEVFNYGGNLLNYAKFDSLYYEGNYEYVNRTDLAPDHGVDIRYFIGDSLEYIVDDSPMSPEDFHFSATDLIKDLKTDCYGRSFSWFTYNGTFGCRLIEPEAEDTLILRDGEFRAIITQFH